MSWLRRLRQWPTAARGATGPTGPSHLTPPTATTGATGPVRHHPYRVASGATGIHMADAVSVEMWTNVDLRRDQMTDDLWIDLGKYVADSAARVRHERASAPAPTIPATDQRGAP